MAGVAHEDLLLIPYRRAIERFAGRDVDVTMIAPPYPALGIGQLRVVRVTEADGKVRLDVSYDDYERLP